MMHIVYKSDPLLDNLRRYQRGEPMIGTIDRNRGY